MEPLGCKTWRMLTTLNVNGTIGRKCSMASPTAGHRNRLADAFENMVADRYVRDGHRFKHVASGGEVVFFNPDHDPEAFGPIGTP